ncbi:MAG: 4-hydroxybutyrate dehydrogenase [Peptostreptococcaceae bacterium]|nr:4-hydroxybutyrate dehydrogenase [Peptostreptococcaceae bacterium]MDY5738540.1 4-hydroxybutyrate dehydrogenase [Anaerovoracaceae bacterium]
MQALRVAPKIYIFDSFKEFHAEFNLGKGDILVTNEWMYTPYIKPLGTDIPVIYQEKYGKGEPSDEMIDAMVSEMKKYEYDRIIAFGGGTIVDICKILALEPAEKSVDLFTGKKKPVKVKELVVIPSTCGTGSEVTNVAIAELKTLHTKKGLAVEETYADAAVLIPESLQGLPDYVFATSSIDALIHAAESYLSPKANPFTEMYSLKAMTMIMEGYKTLLKKGNNAENRKALLKDFLLASNYAGIAFGNAGCGAVHALSYAIGGAFHVPHGEANYQFFTEIFKTYMRKNPTGKIASINEIFANILDCHVEDVYDELENLLNQLIAKKPLREYGMSEAQIDEFAKMTVDNQQRLLANNYVYLSDEEIRDIFANLY